MSSMKEKPKIKKNKIKKVILKYIDTARILKILE